MNQDEQLHSILIDLSISAEEYMKLYAGVATSVNARARDGRRIRFPAAALRPFVSSRGIAGTFQLIVNRDYKLIELKALS